MFNHIIFDIRFLQIFVMASLLSLGVYIYDFSLSSQQVGFTFTAGLLAQLFWINKYKLSGASLLSAGITCLGLVLLLRSNNLWLHPLIAVIAISSKFLIQKNKQHIFNPTAIGLVIALTLFSDGWLSPGQWGAQFILAFWFVALGSVLTFRARQLDMAWYFLLFYIGGMAVRNLYLGYEIEILIHAVKNGSLLLFAFFMITDPKTTPSHRNSKILFAFIIAASSLVCRYYFYFNHSYIYCLVIANLFVPFFNNKFIAPKFQWRVYEKKSVSYSY